MAISLETQEIIFAFAADNKGNFESWGKYELDELQDAIADMPDEDRDSSAGQRVKDRIKELESGHDQVQELRHEEEALAEQLNEDIEQENAPKPQPETQRTESEKTKPKTPMIMAGIIIGIVIMLLLLYFF